MSFAAKNSGASNELFTSLLEDIGDGNGQGIDKRFELSFWGGSEWGGREGREVDNGGGVVMNR